MNSLGPLLVPRRVKMSEEFFPQVMNVREVAAYLRVSQATIYRLAQAGQIPSGKVGRAWRFRKDTIDHWITKHPAISPAAKQEGAQIADE